jgi:hypothetical protein
MTRAQDELHLFGSGKAAILNELKESQELDVMQNMEMNTPAGGMTQ